MELILTRGIPASGKTTWAKAWVLVDPKNRLRVNRDDLRFMLYGTYHGDQVDEVEVTKVQHAAISAALKSGKNVVVDDTNLNERFAKKLVQLGHRHGAEVVVEFFNIPLKTALARNANRERQVPEEVIRQMYDKFQTMKPLDLEPPTLRPYNGTPGKPKAVIVDIDGTLATMSGRSPYEWKRVWEDEVVGNVKDTVNALWESQDYTVIVLSGRDGECYDLTMTWLVDNNIAFDFFWMRAAGDMRPDNIIKAELFDEHIRDNFDVKFVIDDRDQVVDMWRKMGLQCFQVAPGDF